MIFEEGVLSNLIKEIAVGLGTQQTIVETRVEQPKQDFSRQAVELQEEQRTALEERKRRIEESLGFSGIFENTEPLSSGGSVSSPPSNGPLSNYAPNDPGVDISGLMAIAGGHKWKKMI